MADKPTYEELALKVRDLENELITQHRTEQELRARIGNLSSAQKLKAIFKNVNDQIIYLDVRAPSLT